MSIDGTHSTSVLGRTAASRRKQSFRRAKWPTISLRSIRYGVWQHHAGWPAPGWNSAPPTEVFDPHLDRAAAMG